MTDHRILIEFFIDCKELLMSDLMIGLIKLALKMIIDCKHYSFFYLLLKNAIIRIEIKIRLKLIHL